MPDVDNQSFRCEIVTRSVSEGIKIAASPSLTLRPYDARASAKPAEYSQMPRLPAVKRFVSDTGVRVYRMACEVMPMLTGRVYLLLGAGPPTLVDTGSGEGPSTGQILDGFESVRTDFAERVRPSDVGRILLTHAHLDHLGGLAELVRLTGAEVGVHPLDSRIVSAYNERAAVSNRAFGRFLRQAGVEAERRGDVLSRFGFTPDRLGNVRVDFPLRDGDQLDGLRFIHTPGHSPGHVCIAVGDILLAGDHVLARTIPQQWPESVAAYTGLGHYLDSLEKIERMSGIHIILGGHEPPIRNVGHRIYEIRKSHHRRLDRLLELLREAPCPLSIAEITEQMYGRPEGFYAMLALTDVGARVEYLDQRGGLTIANFDDAGSEESPVYRYCPA